MSGTSLDGVDLAACQFDFTSGKWNYSILHAETIPYPSTWKKRLIEVVEWPATRVYETDAALGKYFGQLIREFLSRWDLNADLIASHGHTLFHRPDLGFTTQIGSGASIAAETGLDTLCDFRSKDVALGGQGAPLVPLGDRLLFGEYTACLNLGGIANISYESNNRRVAYDICPVNMALNAVAQQLGLDFDPEGSHARSGIVDFELLQRLNNLDYYRQSGPKSLGREWYEKEFLPLMEMCSKPVDLLRTLSEHIAEMIAGEMNKIEKKGSLLTTGGGALNAFLLERIRALSGWSVIVPDKKLVEFKEALVFAFLGNLYMEDRNNVLSSSTGSVRDHVGGGLYKGN
jgi:anhydro-N-acetylmuramic acid kinase